MKKRSTKRPKIKLSKGSDSELEELCKQMLYNAFAHTNLIPNRNVVQQYAFHPTRNWMFDFAWPADKIAIEVQGYGPGHNSLKGMANDYAKHNQALILGWKILYFMASDFLFINQPQTIATIGAVFNIKGFK